MTVDIMAANMPETTERSYRYHLRRLLTRAGLLSKDDGIESFDFRYLLGSPEKVNAVRAVLQTVFGQHPATAHLMFNAIKHVLGVIPRRVFLLGDDLAVEWSSLTAIVTETLKGEEQSARPAIRSRWVERVAKRQAELLADIGTERREAARQRAHQWMRQMMAAVVEGGEVVDLERDSMTFRQVLFISAAMPHGQRTQVYAELTVTEFETARASPDGSRLESGLPSGWQGGGQIWPGDGHPPPPEVEFVEFYLWHLRHHLEFVEFYLRHLRHHLEAARGSSLLFPGLRMYPSQQGELVREVFGEDVTYLMGVQLRRWHVTMVEQYHREGAISDRTRADLCSFRRHSEKTAQIHYDLSSRQECNLLASQRI